MRRLVLLVGAVLWLGCPGAEERIALAALAEGCVLNSDCQTPLVCAFRRCHTQCETNEDCVIAGERLSCVPSDRPYKVCLLPNESTCVYHTDCPPTLRCAKDLRCRLECLADADCVTGQLCTQGACAAPNELVNGKLPAVDGGAPEGTATCAYTSDCEAPLVCLAGACRPECRSERDCRSDEQCTTGSCVTTGVVNDGGLPVGWGLSCLLNSDCPAPLLCGPRNACVFECNEARDCNAGSCCFQNTCRRGPICSGELPDGGLSDGGVRDAGASFCLNDLACDDGNFCNGIELCLNNRCLPPAHPICDDFNPCSLDMCDAVTRTCSYASLGLDAGDLDQDGYPSVQCGGRSDDCDDSNPDVHPGHPEDCDFIDNNCDGQVDEGLWRERVGARISLHGQARFPWWAGPPSVVAIDGGFIIAASSDTVDGALELVRTNRALQLQQGPLPLFRSRTAWVTPLGSATPFGRRLIWPRLVADQGVLLATAWMGSVPGTTNCAPTDRWTLQAPLVQFDTQLAAVKSWEDIDVESISASCQGTTPETYYPLFASAQPLWSPGSGRWLVSWGTSSGVNALRYLQAATFDADGGLTAQHSLLTPQTNAQLYVSYTDAVVEAPQLVAAADRILVAWKQSSTGKPRYVLMDSALNSAVSPIVDLYDDSADVLGVGLGEQAGRFYLATRSGLGQGVTRVRELDLDGGVVAGPWAFPTPRASTGLNPPVGIDSSSRPDIRPHVGGYIAVTPQWPDQQFTYLSKRNDGGVVSTRLALPATPRSQMVIVPIDETTVGLVWVDGELKRTVMECRP